MGGGGRTGAFECWEEEGWIVCKLAHARTHRLRLKLANNGHQLAEKLNMNVPNHIFYVEANKQRKSP